MRCGVGSMKMGELYLAMGLYEGYAMLLQWSQAKGYGHLRARGTLSWRLERPCSPALHMGNYPPAGSHKPAPHPASSPQTPGIAGNSNECGLC